MKSKTSLYLNLFVAFSMILALFAVQPSGQTARASVDRVPTLPPGSAEKEAATLVEAEFSTTAIGKIDPLLRDAANSFSKDTVQIFVSVGGAVDLSPYLANMIVRPEIFPGMHDVYGTTTGANLLKIASQPGVISIADGSLKNLEPSYDPENDNPPDQAEVAARIAELKSNELTYKEAEAKASDVGAQGWFDVQDGHKSAEAWAKGFDGTGVIAAVIDDGIDFAHPDLMGTYAWVTDENSPYYGWPMAFSQASTQYFANDVFNGTHYIASLSSGSRWSDTQETFSYDTPFDGGTGSYMYQPVGSGVAYNYTFDLTSRSENYKIGSFPEGNLIAFYGHAVAVLVVDENHSGQYDTVYVDLDNDHSFLDEKPATKDSPTIYRDMDGDGYTDISGGLLAWISDGDNPPPGSDWIWGVSCSDGSPSMAGCPDSGDLLIFAGAFTAGYTHGTQCASNVAGQGVVSGGLDAPSFRIGGMVQGAAPNVGLFDMGNFYTSFYDEDHYLMAGLGYDGIPNTGDEVQTASNSYGAFRQMWGSWGPTGRFLTALNLGLAPTTTFLFSAGNEGPGYGPQEGDGSPTSIMVGSSTQYGSTNWDSIASADQIVYGDPNSFFSKGPNRDGSSGVDVLANGGRGAGDEGINYFGFDGAVSWDTWGGTSRSAPVASGNLALVYQAYKARYGVWPTWDVAKALFKSGANNSVSSPFLQGGGVVNADRATDLAAGIYGVYATPDEWQVGDWQGTEYLNFAKVASPGSTFDKTYTVANPSGYDIDVDLSDGVMTKIDSMELDFTTSNEAEESSFNFHSPDYLMELDPADIPADAELMVVRYVHPYDTFDPNHQFDGSPDSSWRFMLYNWTDMNGDGKLWEDANNNGTVNHVDDLALGPDNDGFFRPDFSDPGTEIQEGEYIRVDYEFGGIGIPITVRDPLNRMADGYFFGFQHRANNHTVEHTTFKIGVEFYKRADWSWLSLSDASLSVPAESTATFEATASIPANAAPGAYEGVVYMEVAGDINHAGYETALPVVVNVIADLPDNGAIQLGGQAMEPTLYQNSWTNGYFNWYGGGWTGAGDWRHYFMNIDEADVANKNLLIHTSWNDGYPTDINTWLLGPTADCGSNGANCSYFESVYTSQPMPDIYGPYTLWPIASSEPFRSGATYPFYTSTGGPDDWVMAPLDTDGLYEVALHNVLYSGENLAAQFQVDVGTLDKEAMLDPMLGLLDPGTLDGRIYTDTGSFDIEFTPTIALPDLEATLSGGLVTTAYGPFTVFVVDNGGNFSAFDPNNTVAPFVVSETNATNLHVLLDVPDGQDADLFLVKDSNNNSTLDDTDTVVGSSGNSTGTDEEITIANPSGGRYFLSIAGYDITPDSGVNMDWTYDITAPGDIPVQQTEIFSNTVSIAQNTPADPTTASYSMTITTDERTAGIHAQLTAIPVGSNVDLYVTDETNTIVAQSATTSITETVAVLPVGNYRFGDGHQYTLWVHGYDVPTPPVTPHLRVWLDELNIWLTATDPDVHASAISPGETVALTVNFEKEGMAQGDLISARLIAGPSVLPGAFDELINLTRQDPGPDASFSITAVADRGPSPFLANGLPTVLANTGDTITYTLNIENSGDAAGTFYAESYVARQWEIFDSFVYTDTVVSICSDCFMNGLWDVLYYTIDLDPGESSQIVYRVTFNSLAVNNAIPDYFDVYDTDSMGAFYGEDLVYAYTRSGRLSGADKLAPEVVAPGETFDYTIEILNQGAYDVNMIMTDTLPAEVEFVSASPGASYDSGTHSVMWTGVVPGTSLSSTDVTITVMADAPEGTSIDNEAEVKYNTTVAELSASSLVDDGKNPMLDVSKTVGQLIASRSDFLQYTIVLENNGTEDAVNAELMDMIPEQLEIIESSITGGATYADGYLTWSGDLAQGASKTFTFWAKVKDDTTPKYAVINGAWVWADNTLADVFNSALTEIDGLFHTFFPVIAN